MSIPGYQEQRCIVETRWQILDQAAMQRECLVAAVGQFDTEGELASDRLIELIEDIGELAAGFVDPGDELSRDAGIGGISSLPFQIGDQFDHPLALVTERI